MWYGFHSKRAAFSVDPSEVGYAAIVIMIHDRLAAQMGVHGFGRQNGWQSEGVQEAVS